MTDNIPAVETQERHTSSPSLVLPSHKRPHSPEATLAQDRVYTQKHPQISDSIALPHIP